VMNLALRPPGIGTPCQQRSDQYSLQR
jgi:hypothetical protein